MPYHLKISESHNTISPIMTTTALYRIKDNPHPPPYWNNSISKPEDKCFSIPVDDPRVLFLSGIWTMPDNHYDFTATIYLSSDGSADGTMYWTARTVWGEQNAYTGTEYVCGQVTDNSAELIGQQADPGLSRDTYRLSLTGIGSSGKFHGTSRTCLNNWSGRLWGTYMIMHESQQ